MKIVFFGDSITDADRDRQNPNDLGDGYVKIAASKLRPLYPDCPPEIINRGVGGDRTEQLLKRVKGDVVEEQPEVVVMEVGINDVWSRFTGGPVVTPEEFRNNYAALVDTIKGTGAKLLLLQPYLLKVMDKQRLRPVLNEFNKIICEIAAREKVTLIALDEIFTGVTQDIAASQFAADGIHPTHRGCRYIADLVIKELKKIL